MNFWAGLHLLSSSVLVMFGPCQVKKVIKLVFRVQDICDKMEDIYIHTDSKLKRLIFYMRCMSFLLLFSLIFCCIREMTIYLYKLTFPVASSVCWTVLFTASLYLMCTCISCLFCADLHSNINWSPHWLIKFSQGCQKMCVSFSDIVTSKAPHRIYMSC